MSHSVSLWFRPSKDGLKYTLTLFCLLLIIKFMQTQISHSPRNLSAAFAVPTCSSGGRHSPAQKGKPQRRMAETWQQQSRRERVWPSLLSAHSTCLSMGLEETKQTHSITGVARTWVGLSIVAQPPGLCGGAPSCYAHGSPSGGPGQQPPNSGQAFTTNGAAFPGFTQYKGVPTHSNMPASWRPRSA